MIGASAREETSTGVTRGPVMLGVEGLSLTDADRRRLSHPNVGGVERSFGSHTRSTAR